MGVNLSKGQKVSLTKTTSGESTGLNTILVGLGWDMNSFDTGHDFDCDACVFMTGADGKVTGTDDFVFYGNTKHRSGSVEHMGDNLTGEGDGDDEQIKISLSNVPSNVTKIVFTVTIHDAIARNQNFGQVSNSFIRILDEGKSEEILRYDLGEDFSIETAVVVGEVYRYNDEWKFNAIGAGYQGGLEALCNNYGVEIG